MFFKILSKLHQYFFEITIFTVLLRFLRIMKKYFALLSVCFFFQISLGQKLVLTLKGTNEFQTKTLDSIGYKKDFATFTDVKKEVDFVTATLQKKGFLFVTNKQENIENKYLFTFDFGKNFPYTEIDFAGNEALLQQHTKSIKLKTEKVEDFLNSCIKKLDVQGYPLAKLNLENIKTIDNKIVATLKVTLEKKRTYNDIVIEGYPKFPIAFKKNLKRMYAKKEISTENTNRIFKEIQQYRFVRTLKQPEILFTQDSTKLYVFVEKTKANNFDGFVGFTNDENSKLIFTGNVNVNLQNIVNTGEKLNLVWKSNGKNQKTFNLATELPFIFKSPIGVKAQLNIFKQDSTFQNTQTNLDIGYYFNYNTRVFLGYQNAESSDIQNSNSVQLNDFTNKFYTLQFEFLQQDNNSLLFPEKTNINFKTGTGSRDSKFQTDNQFLISGNFKHLLYLNPKNCIALQSQNFYLGSNQYLTNELFRFGGINSIRGFNENSLQANFFSSILTEYRYIAAQNLYFHTIIDYGYYQDKTIQRSGGLLGLGIGVGIFTKNGLFRFMYSNGSSENQAIKLSNSIIQISLKTNF